MTLGLWADTDKQGLLKTISPHKRTNTSPPAKLGPLPTMPDFAASPDRLTEDKVSPLSFPYSHVENSSSNSRSPMVTLALVKMSPTLRINFITPTHTAPFQLDKNDIYLGRNVRKEENILKKRKSMCNPKETCFYLSETFLAGSLSGRRHSFLFNQIIIL